MSAIEERHSLAGRALGIAWLAAVVAAVTQGALYDPVAGSTVGVAAASLVLVAGGALAGWTLGRDATIRHYVAAAVVPATIAVFALVLMAGLAGSADDVPVAAGIALAIYALIAVPMLLVVRLRRAA